MLNTWCTVVGGAWSTKHCSDDRAVDAGRSVTGTVLFPLLSRELREQQSRDPKLFLLVTVYVKECGLHLPNYTASRSQSTVMLQRVN